MSPPDAKPKCPLCFSTNTRKLVRIQEFDVWRCAQCAADFVSPMPDRAFLNALSDRPESAKGGELSEYAGYDHRTEALILIFERFLDCASAEGGGRSVLEIGCGCGIFLDIASKRGWNCFGVEPSSHARSEIARRYGRRIMVTEDVDDLLPGEMDLVVMHDVLELLADPRVLFYSLFSAGAIVPSTQVVIATPNAWSNAAIQDPLAWRHQRSRAHLINYSAASLDALLRDLRFRSIEIEGTFAADDSTQAMPQDEPVTLNERLREFDGLICSAAGSDFIEFMRERYVPGTWSKISAYEHLPRYRLACDLAEGRRVLDMGCGSGYGAGMLSERAASVLGVDIDESAIEWAQKRYGDSAIRFERHVDLGASLPAGSFGLITCFELIEHLKKEQQEVLVAQLARVLSDEGLALISTPNPQVARLYGPNPYHLREMTEDEYRELLLRSFPHVVILRQWIEPAVLIGSELGGSGGVCAGLAGAKWKPEAASPPAAFVAACSHRPIEGMGCRCFFDASGNYIADAVKAMKREDSRIRDCRSMMDETTALSGRLSAMREEAEVTRASLGRLQDDLGRAQKERQRFESEADELAQRLSRAEVEINEVRGLVENRGMRIGELERTVEISSRQIDDLQQRITEQAGALKNREGLLARAEEANRAQKKELDGMADLARSRDVHLQAVFSSRWYQLGSAIHRRPLSVAALKKAITIAWSLFLHPSPSVPDPNSVSMSKARVMSERFTVALFVHCFFPSHIHGTESYTLDLAKGLKALGHNPIVVTGIVPGEERLPKPIVHYEFEGIPVYAIDTNHAQYRSVRDTYYHSEREPLLREVLRKIRPDIVHVTHIMNHTAALLSILREEGIPTVATFTDYFGICFNSRLESANYGLCRGPSLTKVNCLTCYLKTLGLYRRGNEKDLEGMTWISRVGLHAKAWSMRLLALLAGNGTNQTAITARDIINRPRIMAETYASYRFAITPSRVLRRTYERAGLKVPLIDICFGIDIPRNPKPAHSADQPLCVGYIGQICYHKGPDLLIRAAAKALSGTPYRLKMYGGLDQDPVYSEKLRRMAEGHPVEFCGVFPRARMREVLDGIDVLVIPSRWYENSPLTLLSSLASHTPVVISDVDGMTQYVQDGFNGLVFKRNSARSLAGALWRIRKNPSLLHRLGINASYDMTTQEMVLKTAAVYRQAFCSEVVTKTAIDEKTYHAKVIYPLHRKRPKVVHAIANFLTGGSSRLVVDLIEHLGHKYDQEVISCKIPIPLAYAGVTLHDYSGDVTSQQIADLLKERNARILHVHYWGEGDCEWYKKVFKAAEQWPGLVIENINTPVVPYVSDRIDHYVYVSEYAKRFAACDETKSSVIYPGSNLALFDRKEAQVPDDVIGMVYRLEPDKLKEDAIRVFIQIVKKRPRTQVLIVGGGTFLNSYKTQVAEEGASANIRFTGSVPDERLPEYYQKMSIFVAPVWKESFGQVSSFAMGMSIPIAGYRIGALPEILGSEELLVKDSEELVNTIVRLLDDRQRRIEIGQRNYLRAHELFSVEAMVQAYDRVYEKLIQDKSK